MKNNDPIVVDLCYLCDNFPELPEQKNLLPRDVEVSHLEDLLERSDMVFLNGKEGSGVTTTLALFVKEHSYNCVSFFYDGFTKAWLSPDVIEESLVKQLGFYVYDKLNAISYPNTLIQSLIIKLSQKVKQTGKPLYFVFDGLHTLSKDDYELIKAIFNNLPWSKAKFIFSGKKEDYSDLIPSRLKSENANCLLPFSRTYVVDYFKKLDSDLTKEDLFRLCEICQCEAGKIDYIRTKFEQDGSFQSILDAPDSILSDFYVLETEKIDNNPDKKNKVLLALIAFSTIKLDKDLICEIISISVLQLNKLLDQNIDYLLVDEGYIQFKSAAFRRYICTYLSKLKTDVELLTLTTYEKYGLKYSTELLPLYKRVKKDSIIPFLSANNVEKIHEQSKSHASLNIQYDYGFEAAKSKEEYIGDAFRFAIARSMSNEIEKNEIWDSEIVALIAHDKKNEAIELSQSIYLKEDRLKALIQILALCDSLLTSEKEALKNDIDNLCEEIEFEQIPNRAVDLARLLMPIDFNLAMNIIDKIAKNEKNKISMDMIYAAISMSVNDEVINDSQQGEFNKFEVLKSKIQDEGLKEMASVMKSIYADKSVSEILAKIKLLKPASKQIYFLKHWIPEHRGAENIAEVTEYAVRLLIDDSSIDIPKVSILTAFSNSLLFINDKNSFEGIIRLIDSIEASIKTPTQDYVSLKLIVIESYLKFDIDRSKTILDDLYLYVSDLRNRSTRIDCLSQILSSYAKLGDPVTLANEFMTSNTLLNQIKDDIKKAFTETAYHFKIIQEPIKKLVIGYPSFLKEVGQLINTEERRSKAYSYAAIEYIKQSKIEQIEWSYFMSLVNGIKYNIEMTDKVWTHFSYKLSNTDFKEDLVRKIKSLKDILLMIESDSSRCFVLVHIYLWLYKNVPTESFTSMIYSELYSSWKNIPVPWLKIDIGFNLAEVISGCNKKVSAELLSEILELKHGLIYSSSSNLTAFLESVDLYTRSTGMLIRINKITDDKLNDYTSVISKCGEGGEGYIYWSKICLNYYLAGENERFKKLTNEKILKNLDLETYTIEYRKYLICQLAPVLFLYSQDLALNMISGYSIYFKNICISNIGKFLLHKYPYWDELDGDIKPEIKLNFQEITILISLLRSTDDDTLIFNHVESICKCIKNKNIEELSTIQREHIHKELINIVDSKLPYCSGIQHEGYKIACKMALTSISSHNNRQIWQDFLNQIMQIPNKADQAFLCFYGLGYIDRNDQKKIYLDNGYNIAVSIQSGYDRFTRFNMCLTTCMDSYRGQFSEYYKKIAQDLKGDSDTDLSFGDKMVDLAYQFDDERLVSAYLDIHDDDPIRNRYKIKLQKKLDSTKRISNVIKQTDSVESLTVAECNKCFTKQLNSLLAGKSMIKDVWDIRDTLQPVFKYSITHTKSAVLYFMENAYKKHLLSNNSSDMILKMNEALLFNVKMVMALSTRTNENLERIYKLANDISDVSDSTIRLGEKSKGVKYIIEWFKKHQCGLLQIIDPYFSPDDLLMLKPLFDIENKLKVKILSHHRYANICDFKDSWMQSYDEITGSIDIVSVRYKDKPDDGPLHDRYWVLIDKQTKLRNGIKLNSVSGLGNKESDIATMTNDSISDIIMIWNDYFVDCENKVNGHSLQYEKLYIGK